MSGIRLNKYIASSGLCSRRKADELIESGVVSVNGKKVTELGFLVQDKDKVLLIRSLFTRQGMNITDFINQPVILLQVMMKKAEKQYMTFCRKLCTA